MIGEDRGLAGIYWGLVVSNADPEKLGRVTAVVPGVVEPETAWAPVLGMPGASPGCGLYAPPRVGATVAVAFIQGDIDTPVCWCGPWGLTGGQPDIPAAAAAETPADAPRVWVWATETFEIVVKELDAERKLYLRNKVTGDSIVFNATDGPDGTSNTITINATTSLILNALGVVQLGSPDPTQRPAIIQINGRRVLNVGAVI